MKSSVQDSCRSGAVHHGASRMAGLAAISAATIALLAGCGGGGGGNGGGGGGGGGNPPPPITISGTLTDSSTGNALSQRWVFLSTVAGYTPVETSSTGAFTLTNVPANTSITIEVDDDNICDPAVPPDDNCQSGSVDIYSTTMTTGTSNISNEALSFNYSAVYGGLPPGIPDCGNPNGSCNYAKKK